MNDRPLVSVIIPTHNREDLVLRAVNTALAQTMPDLEVIVVDDASTDGTAERLAEIGDTRVRYVAHRTRRGGGNARNTGMEASRGAYVAFLDSDDVWDTDKLRIQLEDLRGASERVVGYSQVRVTSSGRAEPEHGIRSSESVGDYLFCEGGLMQTSTLILSKMFAARVRFSDTLRRHHDYDFCLRMGRSGGVFRFTPNVLAEWRDDGLADKISRQLDVNASLQFLDMWQETLGPRARTGFEVREVLPQLLLSDQQRRRAATIVAKGVYHGLTDAREAAGLFVRLPFRRSTRLRVRNTLTRYLGLLPRK